MRLIDADKFYDELKERSDAAIKWYKEETDEENKTKAGAAVITFCEVKLTLDSQPTVDAVPVGRCKDCKFNSTEDSYHKLVELPISETSYYNCGKIKVINELPTISAVPVIKCRDCKFNKSNYIPCKDSCFKFADLPISKDFYCACGEIFID